MEWKTLFYFDKSLKNMMQKSYRTKKCSQKNKRFKYENDVNH